ELVFLLCFFFSSRRRHTRFSRDWSSDVCSSDLSTILFAGYQAAGTRGAAMVAGADKVKIHGEYIPVRAEVQNLPMLSAHADSDRSEERRVGKECRSRWWPSH